MNEQKLKELLEVAEKATPGERVASGNGVHIGIHCVATTHADNPAQRAADAKQIATFDPTTCAELVNEVLRLKSLPTIVCLCGSTKFMEAFQEANLRLTLAGEIVLSVGTNTKSDAQQTGKTTLPIRRSSFDWTSFINERLIYVITCTC